MAPFLDPDLEWDFRVPRVQSINTSGHKYGLVYPGVGWAVWRDAEALPDDLIFWVNYLGDNMPTFALNFSRPGSQVVAQYYNFLRLGFEGYQRVQGYARKVATYTSAEIAKMGPFELLTKGDELPVFAFKLKDEVKNYTVFDVSAALRERGWQVPAYTFPKDREDLAALRIVVRRGFTMDIADMLLDDLRTKVASLEKLPEPLCRQGPRRVPSLRRPDAEGAPVAPLPASWCIRVGSVPGPLPRLAPPAPAREEAPGSVTSRRCDGDGDDDGGGGGGAVAGVAVLLSGPSPPSSTASRSGLMSSWRASLGSSLTDFVAGSGRWSAPGRPRRRRLRGPARAWSGRGWSG